MPRYDKFSKSSQGFVLVVVLILMQILALFSWFAVRGILDQQKMIQQQYRHSIQFFQGETILAQIEQNLSQTLPSCLVSMMPSIDLLAKPLSWWRSVVTCTGNFQAFQYYYVVETLGRDLCAILMDTHAAADYFRITVFLQPQSSSAPLYLQSTMIKAATVSTACEGKEHLVSSGRQSWRMMSV